LVGRDPRRAGQLIPLAYRLASKVVAEGQLQDPGIPHSAGDLAEGAFRQIVIGRAEVSVVEEVVSLGAEGDSPPFIDREARFTRETSTVK